jgi:hypothetical protein
VSFALQIFVGHLSWLKTQMALMHWDYIDRLGKSNSIRTAIQENIYDDNIHFIGINNCNASLKVRNTNQIIAIG